MNSKIGSLGLISLPLAIYFNNDKINQKIKLECRFAINITEI